MQGAVGGGWQPVPIEGPQIFALGSIANNLIDTGTTAALVLLSMGTPLGIAGYWGAKTYKQVLVMLDAFDSDPNRIVATYTACVTSGVKSGLTAIDAANRCGAAQKAAQEYGLTKETLRTEGIKAQAAADATGLGFWGWLGVIVGVAVVGYVAFGALRRSVGVARAMAPIPIQGFGYPMPYLVAMPPRPRRYRRRCRGR
jgi:hypothetical protein